MKIFKLQIKKNNLKEMNALVGFKPTHNEKNNGFSAGDVSTYKLSMLTTSSFQNSQT